MEKLLGSRVLMIPSSYSWMCLGHSTPSSVESSPGLFPSIEHAAEHGRGGPPAPLQAWARSCSVAELPAPLGGGTTLPHTARGSPF